jgi:hypothetical protein
VAGLSYINGASVLRRLGNGDPDDRWIYTPSRTWIERHDGSIIAEREKPREAFADHTRMTPWDELHLTYFVGYAMWNYLATPFCFTMPGFVTRELDSHTENGQIWRVLEVTFPDSVPTHCKVQKFYYDDNFMLRRMDYTADVVKGAASHYCWDHKEFGGDCVSDPAKGNMEGSRDRQADTRGSDILFNGLLQQGGENIGLLLSRDVGSVSVAFLAKPW